MKHFAVCLVGSLAVVGCGSGGATTSGTNPAQSSGSSSGGTGGSSSSGGGGSDDSGAMSGSSGGGGASSSGGGGTGTGRGGDASSDVGDAGSETGGGGAPGTCGAGDTNLPAEPTIPAACATLKATQNVPSGGVPSEASLDTSTIQAALTACAAGQAVKLTTSGSNDAFVTGPLTIPTGVTLWVDAGTTLYGTRSTSVYGSATALISVKGANSGIVGDGTIDGQGGEPILGGSGSFWDQNGSGGGSPALIQVAGATNFTLYRITLHNAPMFHVKLGANGFVVWGVTIKTPSKATNSAGTALSSTSAHNTDGIDPGEAASNGFIVCSKISDGDDHIAIKGSSPTGVDSPGHRPQPLRGRPRHVDWERVHRRRVGHQRVRPLHRRDEHGHERRQLQRDPHQVGLEPRRSREQRHVFATCASGTSRIRSS